MKRILAPILIALTFTVMFSSTSFAGWKKVTDELQIIQYAEFVWKSVLTFYVDFERIRKSDEYVYWWMILERERAPLGTNELSFRSYAQGDCKIFRYKFLQYSAHEERMGKGSGRDTTHKNPEWIYPTPNSSNETILKSVCAYTK